MPKLSKEEKERRDVVDELHKLKTQFARLKAKAERLKFLNALVLSWYEDHPAHLAATIEGKKALAIISPREFQRSIFDKQAVYEKLTHEVFVDRCTMPLKVLDELLTVVELATFIDRNQTGPRDVKTSPRAAAA